MACFLHEIQHLKLQIIFRPIHFITTARCQNTTEEDTSTCPFITSPSTDPTDITTEDPSIEGDLTSASSIGPTEEFIGKIIDLN